MIPASGIIIDRKSGKLHIINPGRIQNISQGYYDGTGFHPIRASSDYDPDRAGDDYSDVKKKPKARAKKAATKKPRRKTFKQRVAIKRARKNPSISYVVKKDGRGIVSRHRTKAAARKKFNALVKKYKGPAGYQPYWIE